MKFLNSGFLSALAASLLISNLAFGQTVQLAGFSPRRINGYHNTMGGCSQGVLLPDGTLLGGAYFGTRFKAAKWLPGSSDPIDLGELDPTASVQSNMRSCIVGAGPDGRLIGNSIAPGGNMHLAEWSPSGVVIDRGQFCQSNSAATAGNIFGSVVGKCGTYPGQGSNFIFSLGLEPVSFDVTYQGSQIFPDFSGINSLGMMVGTYRSPMTFRPVAISYDFSSSTVTPLNIPTANPNLSVIPKAISEGNSIVGYYEAPGSSPPRRAMLWDSNGSGTDLGSLQTGTLALAWGVSRITPIRGATWIVGSASIDQAEYQVNWRGFLKRNTDSNLVDLNSLLSQPLPPGQYISGPVMVGPGGHVVTWTQAPQYQYSTYLLTPIWIKGARRTVSGAVACDNC